MKLHDRAIQAAWWRAMHSHAQRVAHDLKQPGRLEWLTTYLPLPHTPSLDRDTVGGRWRRPSWIVSLMTVRRVPRGLNEEVDRLTDPCFCTCSGVRGKGGLGWDLGGGRGDRRQRRCELRNERTRTTHSLSHYHRKMQRHLLLSGCLLGQTQERPPATHKAPCRCTNCSNTYPSSAAVWPYVYRRHRWTNSNAMVSSVECKSSPQHQ